MLDKRSSMNIPCIYCEKDALPDTNPPVCAEHVNLVKKGSASSTLKELEAKGPQEECS